MLRHLLASVALPALPLARTARSLVMAAALLAGAAGAAHAAKGMVSGTEMQGFGRVVFSFDGEVGAKARVVNAVLIVEFDQPVSVDLDKIAAQLPAYVSVVRADPDGKSIRFALNDRFRTDLKLAGERVYLDILSSRWQGHPPALPPEVVQDLVRRARAAEDALRRMNREQEKENRVLDLKVGTATQFRRAIFTMPRSAPVTFTVKDGVASLVFDANFTLSDTLTRQRLAGLVKDIDIESDKEVLRVTLVAAEGMNLRAFREDDAIVIDFTRADGKPMDDVSPPASAEPAKPAAPPAPKAGAASPASPAPQGAPAAPPPASSAAPKAAAPAPALPKALEQAVAAVEALPSVHVEPGVDPEGFALRFRNAGDLPVAVLPRGKGLLALIETGDGIRAPDLPDGLVGRMEGFQVQGLRGATLVRLNARVPGSYWLRREGADLVVERGRSGASDKGFTGSELALVRAFDDAGREALEAHIGPRGALFQIDDPATGEKLTLVGAPGAVFQVPKVFGYAEFSLEPTLGGLAILPRDEALSVKRRPETVMIGHDIRLNLSPLPESRAVVESAAQVLLLDLDGWKQDTGGDLRQREYRLMVGAAESPRLTRSAARLRLARFYLANALYPEADAVLQVLQADDQPAANSKQFIYYRAFVAAMTGRTVEATRLLSEPALSSEPEGRLLAGYVEARAMRYPQAVASFKGGLSALERYPEALQAKIRRAVIEAAIEAEDAVFAHDQLQAYARLPADIRDPNLQQLLAARLADQQGQTVDALAAYTLAANSKDREIEAEARFGKAAAALATGKITPEDARAEFETLAMIWRRSDVEVKALEKLGNFYAAEGRWREAFLASQRATAILPEHVAARRLEDSMARRFEQLFLKNEGDKLSKVETLAIYQEFRQLVPVGRRGDEIARHLAERLLDLDLINEASEILEHQVKNRLEGVARASVATRLAVIYLQNRQPVPALAALRNSRLAVMPNELRRARQLLEARALGDVGRTEVAVEMVADEKGEDVDRLRADIYWKGKRWREAGESYERLLGDAWQQEGPLSEQQRLDAMRAGLAYVLGDEKLSLDRLRGRYLAPMGRTEDAASFNLVTNDKFSRPNEFRAVARTIVNADTMTEFMSAYRKRYPESGGSARPVRSATDGRQSNAGENLPPRAPAQGAG